ncbi:MAG: SDR family oxidoreductase [Clostridia bacterium]|nr:SDR family oxidoreductase [Clostridia bacterium]
MERLDGKRIIVTGGTSGMGEGVVRAFPALGAKVVFWGRNEAAGAKIAAETGAHFIKADVADKAIVDAAMKESVEYLGGVDVLIHAAGVAPHCPAEQITAESWYTTLNINATGTFLVNEAVFPYMKENGGNIINFTSASAFIVSPGQAHYAASKGAVNSWSRTIAKEWMPYNIRVNMIAPCIKTPMYMQMRAMMTPEQLAAHDASMAQLCIGGQMGDMETDFVPLMAFMASDGSKFITGQTISVDGGIMMVR